MERLLITGFEPFGTNIINPSKELVIDLDETKYSKEIIKCVLPTVWGKAQKVLFDYLEKYKPNKVILLGLAAGESTIRIERIGINLCGVIKDNEGKYNNGEAKETKIFDLGDDGLFSNFDYDKIFSELKENDIKVRMSFSAGQYLCNYVLYSALYKAKIERLNMKIGFIHVPSIIDLNDTKPGMDFETMKKALDIAIENC